MAIDKLVDSSQLDNNLTLVANAIRAKGGTSASLSFPTEYITAINAISGSDSGYTRTVVVPEQIVTPVYHSDGNINGYSAQLNNTTEMFEQWSEYIVTFNGTEYYFTTILMWSNNYLMGEQAYLWRGTSETVYPYPFCVIATSINDNYIYTASTDSVTVKIEKIELTGSGGGGGNSDATLITKTITVNGTYSAEDDNADGYSEVVVNVSSGGSGPTYETIVPLQTINCTTALTNGAYGGYISNYTEYTSEGQKYRVIFDGTEYTPLTAVSYGSTYLYVGDVNVEVSSTATLTYPFEIMLYNGQTFYLGVKGSGSHTLQVDKIISDGSSDSANPLKGKIATFTGDSICAGAGYVGGYAKIIGEDYDMTIENIGVSDGTVVQWRDKFCISESIADMRSDADFVMLEGGGNDADWGPQYIPVGTLSSGYDATLDTTTFAGAFEQMLKSAIAKFPNAKIGYIFAHKCIAAFDAPNGAYHTMAVSALEKWGIPYCDLNVMVPPLGYIDDLKAAYTRGDGIHPNEAGYRTFYAPKIAAFMQTMLTDKSLINKTVTTNGTYSAEDDDADGYSSVTVNVPSSAASSWTKVAETSYQVSTTSTSAATVDTWATGHSEIWTSDKIVYIRIRDTAGKRAGYFYGSDNFLVNVIPLFGTTTSTATMVHYAIKCKSDSNYGVIASNGTSGYGVFPDTLYSDGRIRIRTLYNRNNSLTIDGTYKVEVYLLDPAGGVPIFN